MNNTSFWVLNCRPYISHSLDCYYEGTFGLDEKDGQFKPCVTLDIHESLKIISKEEAEKVLNKFPYNKGWFVEEHMFCEKEQQYSNSVKESFVELANKNE